MNITEQAIDVPTMRSVHEIARLTKSLLGLASADTTPEVIVEAVDSCVFDRQHSDCPKTSDDESLIFGLGSLWGEQMVREFSWEWSQVVFHDHDDSSAMGVFSPDRSLVIYPYHFITGCINNGADVTIMLSFNMLRDDGSIPKLPAQGYENVMDNVHHIVPRA